MRAVLDLLADSLSQDCLKILRKQKSLVNLDIDPTHDTDADYADIVTTEQYRERDYSLTAFLPKGPCGNSPVLTVIHAPGGQISRLFISNKF